MTQTITIDDLDFRSEDIDIQRAAKAFKTHGAIVVRGLLREYIDALHRDIDATARQSLALLNQATAIPEGWRTPNNTLFIPAPENDETRPTNHGPGHQLQHQRHLLSLGISPAPPSTLSKPSSVPTSNSTAMGNASTKNPVGGHPKHLHQDSAYSNTDTKDP